MEKKREKARKRDKACALPRVAKIVSHSKSDSLSLPRCLSASPSQNSFVSQTCKHPYFSLLLGTFASSLALSHTHTRTRARTVSKAFCLVHLSFFFTLTISLSPTAALSSHRSFFASTCLAYVSFRVCGWPFSTRTSFFLLCLRLCQFACRLESRLFLFFLFPCGLALQTPPLSFA